MAGSFGVDGRSVPLSLTRTGEARVGAPLKSRPIGRELEGIWNGVLEGDGKELKLVLTMTNHPDGTASGSIVNVQ